MILKPLFAVALASATVFGASSSAYANWMAHCATRSGNGQAYACGATPIEARNRCFRKLPDLRPVLLGLQTSSCQP
jgi:hypothetical protein